MPDKRIKPRRLRPGSVIGVVAPAGAGDPALTDAGVCWLEERGFQVMLGKSVYKSYGYLAGDDAERAADLNDMFADPGIDGIVCLRGGYGAMRILDQIDYELIRRNPKVFTGYSDITALHLSIGQRAGLVTFHGPMAASDMGKDIPEYTAESWLRAVGEAVPLGEIAKPENALPPVCLVPGKGRGRLMGGNLSLLCATLGTPYEIDTRGAILCLEEVGEEPYRIDRLLTQLLLAGKLQKAAGIVFGVCSGCEGEKEQDFTLEEVLRDRLGGLTVPVLHSLHFGHTPEKATLPLGVEAQLDSEEGRLVIVEAAVT